MSTNLRSILIPVVAVGVVAALVVMSFAASPYLMGPSSTSVQPADTKTSNQNNVAVKNTATAAKPKSPTADWYKDPLCQMIFFTTLEGLYRDGVSTEVVDLILGKESKLENKVKHDFVFRCKLCHAVYEAFALYRRRQTFSGSAADTFGAKKVDPKLLEALRSKEARTRVFAMGSFVQPWIKAKLHTLDLSVEDKTRLMKGLINLADEGKRLTQEHRKSDPDYFDWRFYGACQACRAIETVARTMPKGPINLTDKK